MSATSAAVAANGEAAPDVDISDEAIDAATNEPTAEERAQKAHQENLELKARIRAQEDMIGGLRTDLTETKRLASKQGEALNELLESSRDAKDRGYQYAREDAVSRMRYAAKNADEAAHDAALRDLIALEQHRPPQRTKDQQPDKGGEPDKKTQQPQQQTVQDPTVTAWFNDNPWYNTDWELRAYADGAYNNILATAPGKPVRDVLSEVKERVTKRFTDKFPNAARDAPPAVSRPGPQGGKPKPKTKTVADLPEDAKLALSRIKRRDPTFSDDDYLKTYQW